jgi:Tfp pilus assembly pilus retraction ATPase PilT
MNSSRPHTRNLASILLDAGVVTSEQVESALLRQRQTGLRIGETLVELGHATEEDIGWALARQLGIPFVDLQVTSLDRDLLGTFPDGMLWRFDAVPLVRSEDLISIALADPTDHESIEEFGRVAGCDVNVAAATPTAIRRVLTEVIGARHDSRGRPAAPSGPGSFDVQWDRSRTNFLLFHITAARRAGTAEIHFVPSRGTLQVFHRLDGRLAPAAEEPVSVLGSLIARLKALGGPSIDERVLHARGRITCPLGTQSIVLDVSLLQHAEGIAVTMFLVNERTEAPQLGTLGLDPVDLARLRAALDMPAGIGIVTGPPRCGGSTTLAALSDAVAQSGRRVLAFGACDVAIPDAYRVPALEGEIMHRWGDVAVAQGADLVLLDGVLAGDWLVRALGPAASGRLLLVRTDWTDTFAMLATLMERPADRAILANRLHFVVHQRLPRPAAGYVAHPRPVFEVLIVTSALRDAIREGAAPRALEALAAADGFRTLAARLEALVGSGHLNGEEAARLRA